MTQALIATRAPVPGSGKAGLGLLPQQPAGARRTARADLRGEGRRSHPRPRQGRGAQGEQGRAPEADRRRVAAVGRAGEDAVAPPAAEADDSRRIEPARRGAARLAASRDGRRLFSERRRAPMLSRRPPNNSLGKSIREERANARSDRLLHQQSRADRDRAVGARRAVVRHLFAPPARADHLHDRARSRTSRPRWSSRSSSSSKRTIRKRTSRSTSIRRAAS